MQVETGHVAQVRQSRQVQVEAWVDKQAPGRSSAAMAGSGQPVQAGRTIPPAVGDAKDKGCCLASLKADLLRRMLEKLTGKKLSATPPARELNPPAESSPPAPGQDQTPASAQPARQGWGVSVNVTHERFESEKMCFQARAQVRTADGRCIDVDVQLRMQRAFLERSNLQIQAGDAKLKDPLVVNFAAPAVALTDKTFTFDLDADGSAEQLSQLASGSGFLALDRNGNGRIDNGAELFGPQTQDGFGELSDLDDDGNGWIDEGDRAFDQLRLWSPDEQGRGNLQSLEELGIGALSLSAARTSFDLTDQNNQLLGKLRSTSLFLTESGQAGTIQQIDLAT
jgi:hypothetical protein